MVQELSAHERQASLTWLERNWTGDRRCPICGTTKWTVSPHLVSTTAVDNSGNISLGGPSYPMVMLISDPCGYTFFVNAVIAGVVPQTGSHR